MGVTWLLLAWEPGDRRALRRRRPVRLLRARARLRAAVRRASYWRLRAMQRFTATSNGQRLGVPISVHRARFAAEPQCVAQARLLASAHARWVGAESRDVALAVSEAFTNAVVHAYPDTTSAGEVELVVSRYPTELEVTVSDDGQGIIASKSSAGLGVGLIVIKQLTTRFDIEQRVVGGTKLSMYFLIE